MRQSLAIEVFIKLDESIHSRIFSMASNALRQPHLDVVTIGHANWPSMEQWVTTMMMTMK